MFEWSEEDLMVRDAVRGFIEKEVRPHVDELETGQLPPFDIIRKMLAAFGMDSMAAESLEADLAAEEAGEVKKGGGSTGLGNTMFLILNMEMAGVALGLIASMGVSLGLTVSTIRGRGTLAQKRRWLPELVTMEKVGAWAITEPDSGSDALGGMKTTVRRDGEDYILNGNKTFITNGPNADTIVVFAKLDEGDGTPMRERKVLTFVLDSGMEGLTQGPAFKKMGMMSSPTGELFFDDVRLSKDRLLGETEDTGADKSGGGNAKAGFTAERIGIAALSLGIINECQRLSIEYAKSRKLWGTEIARFQLIQLKLAEMEIARINVQNMLFTAIEASQAGKPPSLAQASAMKLYSSRAATEVAMEAVQLFGGNGYMAEYRVEQLARDAKSLMIYAGSNEIQVTHVAKGLLRD
ncbi:MAG: acyl-CoA dehydrogenase family protein [Gordonia sp. (in: high G+C Gram-positive bacteria)]|uniref:acyl-CoA dehydrogenase family protein n=1 Tax=Gordonia sp. (in: high G+C Gram-positive bacteria) TaxID=84139 RepID=UPI003BB6CB61